jgi:hypothetical protein
MRSVVARRPEEETVVRPFGNSAGRLARPMHSGQRLPSVPEPVPRRTFTVLLASARRSLVAQFRVALLAAGLNLTVSPDGLHALMSAIRERPALVILDDELPGVCADYVEEWLAKDVRTAGARVVRIRSSSNAS